MKLNKRGLVGIVFLTSLFLDSNIYPEELNIPTNYVKPPVYQSSFDKTQKINYIPDEENVDRWQTPTETERRGAGDCEDSCFYLHNSLEERGIKSRVVIGDYYFQISGVLGHAWVEYDNNGNTLILDPAMNRICKKNEVNDYKEWKDQRRVKDFIRDYKSDKNLISISRLTR